MLKRLFENDGSYTQLLLRTTLALVIFPHGAQKLLGWFGGHGFSGTMGFFTEQMGLPAVLGFLVIVAESFGALALAAGLLTRVAAIGVIAVMVGAVFTVHLPHGFFMNWMGTQGGEGFEYHLLAIGIAAAVAIRGPGRFSLDQRMRELLEQRIEDGQRTLQHAR